jgi:cytosine/uracil/thiamine/allantoin permease
MLSRGGGLVIPLLKPLYDYAWFVGFFAAGGLYVALMTERRRGRGIS